MFHLNNGQKKTTTATQNFPIHPPHTRTHLCEHIFWCVAYFSRIHNTLVWCIMLYTTTTTTTTTMFRAVPHRQSSRRSWKEESAALRERNRAKESWKKANDDHHHHHDDDDGGDNNDDDDNHDDNVDVDWTKARNVVCEITLCLI